MLRALFEILAAMFDRTGVEPTGEVEARVLDRTDGKHYVVVAIEVKKKPKLKGK